MKARISMVPLGNTWRSSRALWARVSMIPMQDVDHEVNAIIESQWKQ